MRTWLLFLLFPFVLAAQTGKPAGSPQGQPSPKPSQTPPSSGQAAASTQAPSVTAPSTAPQSDDLQEQARAEAEEGIKHTLVSQVEAWNNGNLQGYMAGYWHSPDLTFFSGDTVTKGWEPTLQRYQQRYKSSGKEMGTLDFQDLKIEVVSRRAGVVTGKWQLTMSDGKKPHGLFTLIVKKMPGGWRIVHDHTSAAE